MDFHVESENHPSAMVTRSDRHPVTRPFWRPARGKQRIPSFGGIKASRRAFFPSLDPARQPAEIVIAPDLEGPAADNSADGRECRSLVGRGPGVSTSLKTAPRITRISAW